MDTSDSMAAHLKANGVQNVAGILVAGIQGVYGECSKVATTLQPNLSDIDNWKNAAMTMVN